MDKVLGIDYGTKRVGIAVSDDNGELAFPNTVLQNDTKLISAIGNISRQEGVVKIVVGESLNYRMEPNKLMADITPFVESIQNETGLQIYLEPEYFTSEEAEKVQGKNKLKDASAAALILQRYLDKQ